MTDPALTNAPDTSTAALPGAPTVAAAQTQPTPPRRSGAWLWLLTLIAVSAAVWFWYDAERHEQRARAAAAQSAQRLQALESRVEGLRRDTRSHTQRLQQADATNRVLRDELLGISQRSTIIEDQVAKLADANRQGAQALRLEETELLLTAAEQRLALSADLDGARRAYALAAGVLEGIDAPGMLNLRQTLTQERADLDGLKADPAQTASAQLDAFAAALPKPDDPTLRTAPAATDAPWWERMFAKLVTVAPADPTLAISGEERSAGFLALQLELTLARAAIERRDEAGYRAALARAEAWLPRLWPDSPTRRKRQAELVAMRALPLRLSLPTLGSTLEQLRSQRVQR
jgi:uroporphyrin-III C-methyltransferase